MNSTIFAVALVPPKANVFQAHIKHLLVLATGLNIAVLGVTFKKVTNIEGNIIILSMTNLYVKTKIGACFTLIKFELCVL